jgi:UDP-N-acetylglucosamine diphosphorylase/glucosamine-1-phosphate N-acetyltransferase
MMERGCFTDTRRGPIILEDDVEIQYGSRVSGPTWIRRGSQILSARLREGTCIGEVCKVGGEVEHSIVEAYSNKAHESFLGHSYVGEWVNLGAQMVTSNLKNTYGTVKMNIAGERVNSGLIKLGVLFADYSKASIATAIYAGKRIGVASQIHGVVTDDVPSFTSWAASLGKQPYEILLESALETQKRMFSRRGVEQKKCDIDLLTHVYDVTMQERMRIGVKRGTIP